MSSRYLLSRRFSLSNGARVSMPLGTTGDAGTATRLGNEDLSVIKRMMKASVLLDTGATRDLEMVMRDLGIVGIAVVAEEIEDASAIVLPGGLVM